mmetsp:Transcript_5879/g.6764  ORF Transcript_5879/g.6764 Transcript_5879/m.6764 type:complete len:153 (-) Transcript_5879:11-469(-)
MGFIIVNLLASLVWWGIDLNSISTTNLVVSIGLIIDYSAHIIHFYGTTDSSLSRNERVTLSLEKMGPPVLMGAFTTFVGVIPLSFAGNLIFRTFFMQFSTIVLVGSFHGLVVLPVLLSLIGSKEQIRSEEYDDEDSVPGKRFTNLELVDATF